VTFPISTIVAILVIVLAVSAYFAVVKMPLHPQDYLVVSLISAAGVLGVRWLLGRGQRGKTPGQPKSGDVDK